MVVCEASWTLVIFPDRVVRVLQVFYRPAAAASRRLEPPEPEAQFVVFSNCPGSIAVAYAHGLSLGVVLRVGNNPH